MRKPEIMVVEDETLIARGIKESLEGMGYAVRSIVASGEEAVERAVTEEPNLILMDIQLRDEMTGTEAAERIRVRCDIPIVFLSAYADESRIEQAKVSEPFGYLVKPVRDVELRANVEMALYRHKTERALRENERRYREQFEELQTANALLQQEIAERKQAEDALEASRDYLEELTNSMWDAVFSVKMPERVIEWANDSFRLIGYEPSECIGKDTAFLYADKDDFLDFGNKLEDAMAAGKDVLHADQLLKRKNGENFPAEITVTFHRENDEIVSVTSIVRDITERKAAEEELRKLSHLIEQSPLSIVITDVEGRIEYVNPGFTEISGFAAEEALGENPRILKSGHHTKEFYGELWDTIGAGRIWRGQFQNKTKNGDLRWMQASISSVKDEHGTLTHFMSIEEDITERKRAEEALAWEGKVDAALADLSSALLAAESIEVISNLALDRAKDLTGSEYGFVGHIDTETGFLISSTLTRNIWDKCQVADKKIVFEKFHGLWGWVLNERKPLMTNCPQDDPRSLGTPEGHIPISNFLSAPALIGDELVGQVALANSPKGYTDRDLEFIERVAATYAIAVDRARSMNALRQSEAQVRVQLAELDQVYRYAPVGLALLDRDYRIVRINERLAQINGLSVEDHLGRTLDEVLPELAPTLKEIYRPVFEKGEPVLNVEIHGVTAKEPGVERDWLGNYFPFRNAAGEVVGLIGGVVEVTEHKQAEEALRESEERYRTMFDSVVDGICPVSPEGVILDANPAYERMLGYTRDDLVGRPVVDIVHPDHHADMDEFIRQIKTRGSVQLESVNVRSDGTPFPIEVRGALMTLRGQSAVLAIVRDITERKQIEDTQLFLLQCGTGTNGDFFESLARYLAENLGMDYVFISRLVEEGLAAQTVATFSLGEFVDNVTYALKDSPCGDMVGKTICCHPRHVRRLFPKDLMLKKMGAESYVGTTLWSVKGQPIGLIAVIGRQPLADSKLAESMLQLVAGRAGGELGRTQAERALREAHDTLELRVAERTAELTEVNERLLREMADRQEAEQALEAQRVLGMRADRLVALGQMSAGIAHELNQPLVGIRGMAERLLIARQRGWDSTPEEEMDKVQTIMEQVDRMTHIIDHIRLFAREAGKPDHSAVQVNDVCRSCLEMVGAQFHEHGFEVETEFAVGLPNILANPFSLEEVVYNLLTNARDAVEERIAAEPDGTSRKILLRTYEQDEEAQQRVCIDVVDSGTGIAEEMLDHLLEPFFTTKSPDRGTGLGLAITNAIIEEWGGKISIQSTLGEGTTMTVSFPILTLGE